MNNKTVQEEAAAKLLLDLDGDIPWLIPWQNMNIECPAMPRRIYSGDILDGFAALQLWNRARQHGYLSNYWLTFDEIKHWGGHLSARSKSKSSTGQSGAKVVVDDNQLILFNAEQCAGLPYYMIQNVQIYPEVALTQLSVIMAKHNISIHFGGTETRFDKDEQKVYIPSMFAPTGDDYWSELFGALIAWALDPRRCGLIGPRDYEALVIEIGGAFMSAVMGIRPHVLYPELIETYRAIMHTDPRVLVFAAKDASRAFRYLIRQELSQA